MPLARLSDPNTWLAHDLLLIRCWTNMMPTSTLWDRGCWTCCHIDQCRHAAAAGHDCAGDAIHAAKCEPRPARQSRLACRPVSTLGSMDAITNTIMASSGMPTLSNMAAGPAPSIPASTSGLKTRLVVDLGTMPLARLSDPTWLAHALLLIWCRSNAMPMSTTEYFVG